MMQRFSIYEGREYRLIVEVKGTVEFSKLEADISCQQDEQAKEAHLIEVDRFIHNAIYLYIILRVTLKQLIETRMITVFLDLC